ncbi:MAG: glycosyltransferase family 39 protein [Candidatus Riflebacteria bacterium]|nr:glycosyltransferase family 39 protein [Candidatus Riflebacteria bacterium]
MKNKLLSVLICIIAFYFLYFHKLGNSPLFDPDEPIYGKFVQEMVKSGDYLTPSYNGKIWYDKPPLFYWLSSFCTYCTEYVTSNTSFRVSETAMRLPSAVLGVLLVILVFFWGSIAGNFSASLLSAIVMATCLQQIILCHAAVTDITLTFFLTLSLFSISNWLESENAKSRHLWAVIAGIAAGLAMLTKGPVSIVLLPAALIIHLAITKKLRQLLSFDTLLMVIFSLLVGLPWFIISWKLHPEEFYHDMILVNHIQRFLKPEHPDQTGHFFSYFLNIPILFIFFFPWSMFLIQSLRNSYRRFKNMQLPESDLLALIWIGVVFCFFSISKTQLVTYIFPLYPAAALIVGKWFANITGDEKIGVEKGLKAGLGMSLILLLTISIAAFNKFPEALFVASSGGAIFLLTFFVAFRFWKKDPMNYQKLPFVMALGMIFFSFWLMEFILPVAGARGSTRDIVKEFEVLSPEEKIFSYRLNRPSLPFYSQRVFEKTEESEEIFKAVALAPKNVEVLCKDSHAEIFLAKGGKVKKSIGGVTLLAFR